MSYLSRRMREIRSEERDERVLHLDSHSVYALGMRLTPYDHRGRLIHERAVRIPDGWPWGRGA